MKTAITGATGFLGRALIEYLSTHGHVCLALTRDPARARATGFPEQVEIRHIDDIPPVDAVIHLAAESPVGLWTPWKRHAIYASRVEGTRRLVAALRHHPPRTLLSASAIGFYGHRPGEILDESSPADPHRRFRARVCLAWEQAAAAAQHLGTRVVNLRLGNVMDPSGGFLGHLLPIHRLGAGFMLGDAEASVSWISLFDAVRLIGFALENEALNGPLNVVAPNPITQRTLATGIAGRLGRRVRGRIPAPLLRAVLGEFSSTLIDDQNVVPVKALGSGFMFTHPAWRCALDAMFEDAEVPRQSTKSAIS